MTSTSRAKPWGYFLRSGVEGVVPESINFDLNLMLYYIFMYVHSHVAHSGAQSELFNFPFQVWLPADHSS